MSYHWNSMEMTFYIHILPEWSKSISPSLCMIGLGTSHPKQKVRFYNFSTTYSIVANITLFPYYYSPFEPLTHTFQRQLKDARCAKSNVLFLI